MKTKLHLTTAGDSSVGIPPQSYTIECPFDRVDTDDAELRNFKTEMELTYSAWLDEKVLAVYDFEIEEMEQQEQQNFICLEHIDYGKPRCQVQCPFCKLI